MSNAAPYQSPQRLPISLNLPPTTQGQRVAVVSFAYDQNGRVGYSVPSTVTTPARLIYACLCRSALIVHGRTYTLPRQGIAGDVAVDVTRGHVFVSNTKFNRLEVWQGALTALIRSVSPLVRNVGYGHRSTIRTSILVANSGGTNISRVDMQSDRPAPTSARRSPTHPDPKLHTLRVTK